MAKLITVAKLKKGLNELSKEELIDLVLELQGFSKLNHEFLTFKLSNAHDLNQLQSEYKNKIEKNFFPRAGSYSINVKEGKQILFNFLSTSNNHDLNIDLMIFYIETCLELLSFGIENTTVFNSITDVFSELVNCLNKEETNDLFKKYRNRIDRIVSNSEIRWDLSEVINDLFYQINWYEFDEEEIED